jgi:hypothetical protein
LTIHQESALYFDLEEELVKQDLFISFPFFSEIFVIYLSVLCAWKEEQ